MPTYYEILGCDKSASHDELKRCYHEQVKKFHPDKSGEAFRQRFLQLDEAWKILRDDCRRKEYDLTISKSESEEMPVFAEVTLAEMTHESDNGTYTYECRCGGVYAITDDEIREEIGDCSKIRISCDECTFHVVVKLGESFRKGS